MPMIEFWNRRTIEECQPVKFSECIRNVVVAPVHLANPVGPVALRIFSHRSRLTIESRRARNAAPRCSALERLDEAEKFVFAFAENAGVNLRHGS